jgi:hypothetical protein
VETPLIGTPHSPRILWVERLSAPEAIWLCARRLLTHEEIYFDLHHATERAKHLAQTMGMKPVDLSFAPNTHDFAFHEARENLLDQSVGVFVRERLSGRLGRFQDAFNAFFSQELSARITFLLTAELKARQLPGHRHYYYVTRHPANILLPKAWASALATSPSPAELLRYGLAPLGLLARAFWSVIVPANVRHNLTGKPAVWLEYSDEDVGRYDSRSFWKNEIDPAKWDRAYFLTGIKTAVDSVTTDRMGKDGMRWIDACRPELLAGLELKQVLSVLAVALRSGLPFWAQFFELLYETTTTVWHSAFQRYRVRLISQCQESSWTAAAQAEAIDRNGGAMFGLQQTEFPFIPKTTHPNPEHVFFVWGALGKRWLETKGHHCRRILPSGIWQANDLSASVVLRSRLGPATFLLAVDDSQSPLNEKLDDYLTGIISVLESHPTWKAFLRSKNVANYSALPHGDRILRQLRALESDKRLVILEPTASLIDVSHACDLTVCLGLTNYGLLAGARGARVIHWDATGWETHPLWQMPRQKIIYHDLESLFVALKAAPSDKSIGDYSSWRRLTDYFGDNNAAQRVGAWINDALQSTAEQASLRYIERHHLSPDYLAPGKWWIN